MAWICGVEEAGRGPVIGPMAMACLWTQDEELLRRIGAKDSKQLTPAQREDIFEELVKLKEKKVIGFELVLLSTEEIDAAVEGEHDNLNLLELRTSAKLINLGLAQAQIERALIDCPTRSTEKYGAAVAKLLDRPIEVIAENKADENYPVVGAASIVAKVTRDREIRKIKERIGMEIGSGYPADPFTQKFLRENYRKKEYADLFRKSWGSFRALAAAAKQPSLFAFGVDAEKQAGEKAERHAEEIREFQFLKEHGFDFVPTKSPYEIIRMAGPDATVIKYTTGKVLVQGKAKARIERILEGKSLL